MLDSQRNYLFNSKFNLSMAKATKIVENPKTDRRILLRIHEALKSKGLNASKLGRALGFSDQYGSQLMRGARKLSVNQLMKIAEILEIDPASLLPGPNPEERKSFEVYIREIVQEEIEKVLKKK